MPIDVLLADERAVLPRRHAEARAEMESLLAYMGDAFFSEWIATLDELKKLDFAADLPGHGSPFTQAFAVAEEKQRIGGASAWPARQAKQTPMLLAIRAAREQRSGAPVLFANCREMGGSPPS